MTEENPVRILHVEDNPRAIQITHLYLKGQNNNFKITSVLSAEQALEKLEMENFEVVISDYEMPEMNGIELLEELRKKGNKIPFIILTGKGKEKEAIEALNKGVDRYIKKGGNPSILFDTLAHYIQEVIEERRKEEEAHNALSLLLEEEKKLKSLERNGKEQIPQESYDASTLLNEHLDLIILGILVDRLADEGTIQTRMSEDELIGEIHRKCGIKVDSEALHTSVVNLKGKGLIIEIGGKIVFLPKSATYHHKRTISV